MIGKIEFDHPCCDACPNQDLHIESEKFYSYDNIYITRNYISCSHEAICKKLLEEREKAAVPLNEPVGIHEELGILGQ